MKTMDEVFNERRRQIERCRKICGSLNEGLSTPRYTYRYDDCESGFTKFYFILNTGAEMLVRTVKNEFLGTDESKILSDYSPCREQLLLWSIQGLL